MHRIMNGSGTSGCHAILTSHGTLSYDETLTENMDHLNTKWDINTVPFRLASIKKYGDKTTTVLGYSTTQNVQLPTNVNVYNGYDRGGFKIPLGIRTAAVSRTSNTDHTTPMTLGNTKTSQTDLEVWHILDDVYEHNNFARHKDDRPGNPHKVTPPYELADYVHQNSVDERFATYTDRGTYNPYYDCLFTPTFREYIHNFKFINNNGEYCDANGNVNPVQAIPIEYQWLGKGCIAKTDDDAPNVYFNIADISTPVETLKPPSAYNYNTFRNSVTVEHSGPVKMGIECIISGEGLTEGITGAKDVTTYAGCNGWFSLITKGFGNVADQHTAGVNKLYNFSALKQLAPDVYYLCDPDYYTITSDDDYENGKCAVNFTWFSQGVYFAATGVPTWSVFRKARAGETGDKIWKGFSSWHDFERLPEEEGGAIINFRNYYNSSISGDVVSTVLMLRDQRSTYGLLSDDVIYSAHSHNSVTDIYYGISQAGYYDGNNNYRYEDIPGKTGIVAMNWHFTAVDE